jgi:fatty-acyl-CoA synthase
MTALDLAALCPLTVDRALHRAAALAPDVEAIVGPGGRLTYAELAAEVARIRGALAAAGVAPGEHVGICLGNGPRWMALFLAIGSLGAVAVPLNTRWLAEEMGYALGQARVRTLVLADRILRTDQVALLRAVEPAVDTALPGERLPALRRLIVIGDDVPRAATGWDAFLAASRPTPPNCAPDDPLLIQYTSGTTAFPKGVVLPHRAMCANGFVSGGRMGLRIADRFHSARPFFHVAGTTLSILSCVQHAATLVTMERFEPAEALRMMEAERCTHVSGNDTMMLMLLNHPDRAQRTLMLRGAWAAASPAIVQRVIAELGARECVVGYGLSEASPNVAQSAWWEAEAVRVSARMRLQPGIEVRIRDLETGADGPPGTAGEIMVRGWSVMRGYYDKPAETEAALDAEGWLATGDLGSLDETGRLAFLGRAKEILRVGGENVSPAEIEDILHRHPAIRQAVVVGVPDPRLIEVVCAFVVLNEGAATTPEAIIEWSKSRMAGFKVPRHVRIVQGFEGIGMTASSKVQKKQLAAHARQVLGL